MKLLITGASGMLGSSLKKHSVVYGHEILIPNRLTLNLENEAATLHYLNLHKPDAIIHAAARVGGISANISNPFDFLTLNLRMDGNLLGSAKICEIPNVIYIGSSCMYPKNQIHAMTENEILTGPLESTNEGYALAKLVGWKTVQIVANTTSMTWRTVILSNLYGPNDHFEPTRSHLLAAIIQKVMAAKATDEQTLEMWGDGSSRREFTYVDDVAEFLVKSLTRLDEFPDTMNVGAGIDHTVREYYEMVMRALDYRGEIRADLTKPTGMKRKLMDTTLAQKFGWQPQTSIEVGVRETIAWYREHQASANND